MYPALQLPEQVATESPSEPPYEPAKHSPLHADVFSPATLPYRPTAHKLQLLHPDKLYRPKGHTAAVADVEPDTQ